MYALLQNLQTTAGNELQAEANFFLDNAAVGQNGTTNLPSSPSTTDILSRLSALGIGAPNNTGWAHLGNGWTDYFSSNTMTFEGIGNSQMLSGGLLGGAPSGSVASNAILQLTPGSGWPYTIFPGAERQVAVGNANNIWALSGTAYAAGNASQIYKWNTSTKAWDQITGALSDISVGSDGEVWGLNNTESVSGGYKIYRYNGSGWDLKVGGLTSICVASASYIWGINSNRNAFYWNGSSWTQAGTETFLNLDVIRRRDSVGGIVIRYWRLSVDRFELE